MPLIPLGSPTGSGVFACLRMFRQSRTSIASRENTDLSAAQPYPSVFDPPGGEEVGVS